MERKLNTNDRGVHSELLAKIALVANGYKVLEPTAPYEPYDLAFRLGSETLYVQVKTAYMRDEEKYNGEWIIVRGLKNNGSVYTLDEVDYFILVWDNKCYMFPNRELQEYWFREKDLETNAIYLPMEVEV